MLRYFALSLVLPLASAFCPLHGPVFPSPENVEFSSTVQAALDKLTAAYNNSRYSSNRTDLDIPTTAAIAVQLFTTSTERPIFEYYHQGTILSNVTGVRKLDGESVWRIGSISKLITTYLLLKEVGDTLWDVAVTDVVPELREVEKTRKHEIYDWQWDQVTLGSLAGQISGVVKDGE